MRWDLEGKLKFGRSRIKRILLSESQDAASYPVKMPPLGESHCPV